MINYDNIEFVAKTQFGLEECLAEELKQIGAKNITPVNRAVTFTGNQEILYKANLWLRTAINVLVPIRSFTIRDQEDLYRKVKNINWDNFFNVNNTFSIRSTVKSSLFNHTQYPALKSKDAIVDQFREKYGKRPSVELDMPDIKINIHITDRKCIVSLDSSGKTLNKRGYRQASVLAPINEVLAAGILKLINWKSDQPLVDPMSGSGTFPIEAALLSKNIAPGLINPEFAFQNWKDFDKSLWSALILDAKEKKNSDVPNITANDIDSDTVFNTTKNIYKAGVGQHVDISNEDFFSMKIPENSVIIINPPYDVRLQKEDISELKIEFKEIRTDFNNMDKNLIEFKNEMAPIIDFKKQVQAQIVRYSAIAFTALLAMSIGLGQV